MIRIKRRWPASSLVWLTAGLLCVGCATSEKWIERRPPDYSLASQLLWLEDEPVEISAATQAVAQPRGLDPTDATQRGQLLALLEQEAHSRLSPELEFALSELAATEADVRGAEDVDAALGFYAESLVHGYRALAADERRRVPGTTRRYNKSLAALLHVLKDRDQVRPGAQISLPLTHSACSVAIELHSQRWTAADFQSFEFAGDYQVLGLRNHYHTSGIGVPLIGVRYHPDRDHPSDKYYPQKLCYPLTAVVRAEEHPPSPQMPEGGVRLVLELHDPTDHETFDLAGRRMPLETDLTTPLAYYLDQPDLQERDVSTLGLLKPGSVNELKGLYLLEPFDPNRIPVVMVHGLWSSPATWMEMFNDLRSDPRVRHRYQFWFYLYPTGNPFWVSAAQMRNDLAELRTAFDPQHAIPALDQTVLVGHSMGGLLSRLQTVDSGHDFWRVVSERQFHELKAEREVRRHLSDLFYFQPSTSVQRVVTIGTPHRGSRFSNGFTQWLGTKLIAFPMQTLASRQELFRTNPGFFRPNVATRVMTSIDDLRPESPMLAALLAARSGPWVRYHNVVGDQPRSRLTSWFATRGDGVVSLDSARLDDLPQLKSQIVVPEDHVTLHRHPQSIEEVRRVLLEHLNVLAPSQVAAQTIPVRLPPAAKTPTIRLASGVAE